jgi:hypothetical protein
MSLGHIKVEASDSIEKSLIGVQPLTLGKVEPLSYGGSCLSHSSKPLLRIDIHLDCLCRNRSCCTGKIRACPKRWESAQDYLKLSFEREASVALQLLNHVCRTIVRPDTNKDVNMIWLNCQREDCPSFLLAFSFKKLLTTIFDPACENRLSALWAPDEMVDHQMDSVLISRIFDLRFLCRIHACIIHRIRLECKSFRTKFVRRDPQVRALAKATTPIYQG